jgi:Protein of unknown function (DUF4232)
MVAPPTAPIHGDPEAAVILEARGRQRRRRLIISATVAVVAGLALGTYAALGGSRNQRTATSAAVRPPACRSSQLSASFTPGGAAGTSLGGMLIHNTGNAACSLPVGRPVVQVIFRGKPLATTESSWPKAMDVGKRAGQIVPPGTKTFFEIGWSGMLCPNPYTAPEARHATLSVRFRGGLRLAVPETPADRHVSLPGCGETVTPPPGIMVSQLLLLPR